MRCGQVYDRIDELCEQRGWSRYKLVEVLHFLFHIGNIHLGSLTFGNVDDKQYSGNRTGAGASQFSRKLGI